jgi:purine-binding chemotaxis protein CheW
MKTAHSVSEKTEIAAGDEQFLTFKLVGEDYGIAALKVQEIKGWEKVTPIPNSPPYVRGVLNLRGLIIPIIDLRLRFNLMETEYTPVTAIIVVNINERLAGLVVDSVSDVIDVGANQRCSAPDYAGYQDREFIDGLAKMDGKLLVLLDVDRLINPEVLAPADVESPGISAL